MVHQFVFGYGSLAGAGVSANRVADRTPRATGFVADLRGARRGWGVAMDNRRDLPGYKYYTDAQGRRPAAFVCFPDVVLGDDCGDRVNGLCLPVTAAQLPALDARERNYVRVDVSARVDADDAQVWAYVGSDAGRARFSEAIRTRAALIHADYLSDVHAAFRALGDAEYAACAASLAPGAIPVRELRRHELPPR